MVLCCHLQVVPGPVDCAVEGAAEDVHPELGPGRGDLPSHARQLRLPLLPELSRVVVAVSDNMIQ